MKNLYLKVILHQMKKMMNSLDGIKTLITRPIIAFVLPIRLLMVLVSKYSTVMAEELIDICFLTMDSF